MPKVARTSALAAITVALLTTSPTAHAQQITVGTWNGENCYPFVCMSDDNYTRYQQVYAASEFPDAVFINAITFYMSSEPWTYDGNFYTISFSNTPKGPNELLGDLNANPGPNNTVFFAGVLNGNGGPSFTISGLPFLYDPSLGNLLMDVTSTGTNKIGYVGFFDADYSGTVTSRAYGNEIDYSNVDPVGLVTTFDTALVAPEPATVWLLAPGLAAIAGLMRRRTRAG